MPIGSFACDIMETVINESYFQGINILNDLQKRFHVDSFLAEGEHIDISDFNKVYVIQSNQKSPLIITNNLFNNNNHLYNSRDLTNKILKNIAGFVDGKNENILTQLNNKDIKSSLSGENKLNDKSKFDICLKDLLLNLILNITYNLNLKKELNLENETLKKLVMYYKLDSSKANGMLNQSVNEEILDKNNDKNDKSLDAESIKSIRHTIDFLVKIINLGLDKEKSEFDSEMKEIITAIIDDIQNRNIPNNSFSDNYNNLVNNKDSNKDLFDNIIAEKEFDLFAPLTFYNKNLQNFSYNLVDYDKDDFFEVYLCHLKNILIKNFIPGSMFDSDQDAFYCKTVSSNLLKEMKIDILLVEDEILQSNIYDENENPYRNLSSLTNFINKLYLINKNIDSYYKNKESKLNNPYKDIIDNFFETFNFYSSNKNKNKKDEDYINDNNPFKKQNANETETEIIFESNDININLDFNRYFNLSFNYIVYLLPGNSHELIRNRNNFNTINNAYSNSALNLNNINNNSHELDKSQIQRNFNNISNINNINSTNNISNKSLNSVLNPTGINNNDPNCSSADAKRQSHTFQPNSLKEILALKNPNISNTGFLSRYISKKDYIYKMLIANLWSNIDYESSEDEFIKDKRFELLKANLDFYIKEAENIFSLFLFKIELIRIPYMIFNLNRTLTNTANDVNDSVEFLFWKNLKIIRKEDDNLKKKFSNEANLITIE